MVVIHRVFGYRFVIYTADHAPAHVHVTGPGQGKINLLGSGGRVELVYSVGISRPDMRRLMQEADARRSAFLEAWEQIHGRSD